MSAANSAFWGDMQWCALHARICLLPALDLGKNYKRPPVCTSRHEAHCSADLEQTSPADAAGAAAHDLNNLKDIQDAIDIFLAPLDCRHMEDL